MGTCKGHIVRGYAGEHVRTYPNCAQCHTAELESFKDQVLEAVLGPKEFLGAPVIRDYSDRAFWCRLYPDKQLLSRLRRKYLQATGASSKGLTPAARNDRLWTWLESQLDKANKPAFKKVYINHVVPGCRPHTGILTCMDHTGQYPVIARTWWVAASTRPRRSRTRLRLKVAELEGRLALQKLRSHPRMAPSGGLAYTVALLTCMGIGALLGFLINLG